MGNNLACLLGITTIVLFGDSHYSAVAAEPSQKVPAETNAIDVQLSNLEEVGRTLIEERLAAMEVQLPTLSVRGMPQSRCFDTIPPRRPSPDLENPSWRRELPINEEGVVELDLLTAFRLATLHSVDFQNQIESLYAAAWRVQQARQAHKSGRATTEHLQQTESLLDARIKIFVRFRQHLYAKMAIGEGEEQMENASTDSDASLTAVPRGGFLELVQYEHRLQLMRDVLSSYGDIVNLLEASLEIGVIDLTQVDQCRQIVQALRGQRVATEHDFHKAMVRFQVDILGLPADVKVGLAPTFPTPCQLIAPSTKRLLARNADVAKSCGRLTPDPSVEELEQTLQRMQTLFEDLRVVRDTMANDLQRLAHVSVIRESTMADADRRQFRQDKAALTQEIDFLEQRLLELGKQLTALRTQLASTEGQQIASDCARWAGSFAQIVRRYALCQTRVRVEAVYLDSMELTQQEAICHAKENDLSLIEMQSQLRTMWARLMELPEDNRTTLEVRGQKWIEYQRMRRAVILRQDRIEQSIRNTFDDLARLQTALKIQRLAVAISLRQVDMVQNGVAVAPEDFTAPTGPPIQFGPTAATDCCRVLNTYRETQERLVRVWLNHYAARIRLFREMGSIDVEDDEFWAFQTTP